MAANLAVSPMRTIDQPIYQSLDVGWPLVYQMDSLTGWTQGSDVLPDAYDVVTIVDGALTISAPGDGVNNSATEGAGHGLVYREFPAAYSGNFKAGCWWSGVRPAEGTPIIHVDLTKAEGGLGMWPIADILPATPGDQPVWTLAVMGDTNASFASVQSSRGLTAAETDQYNDSRRAWMEIYSVGTKCWVVLDGVHLGVELTIPVNLRGSRYHGIEVDNNQCTVTPGDSSAPYPRTADVPAAYGPLVITKL